MTVELSFKGPLKGEITVPPDKSISHRAAIFSSIAEGESIIRNYLIARDPLSTLNALRLLSVDISVEDSTLVISGRGLHGLREPEDVINCENSGTTMRLLSGLLAGQPFFSVLTGDSSLRQRPMGRVILPLRMMGAHLVARRDDSLPPIAIKGGGLKGIEYTSPHASAQVKSAVLLAGLYAEGETSVIEPHKSRDHTERMLSSMGVEIKVEGLKVTLTPPEELSPVDIIVPGDFSSAAFFIVAALIIPGSEVLIRNVGVNPTRTGLLDILMRMGAEVEILNQREVSGEPVADILSKYTPDLRATEVKEEEIPRTIDEFPVLTVAATQAEGITTIRGASELRVKESDRIAAMVSEFRKMGADIEEYPDGVSIKGPVKLKGAQLSSYGDHRIAMALSVAALLSEEFSTIDDSSSVDISFPGFYEILYRLSQ
jgi:3-phosphoshikimate 1-carboxyvinyltransferase